MVDTRPTGPNTHLPVRTDGGGSARTSAGRSVEEARPRRSHSGRVPTLKQLASLVVDGVLNGVLGTPSAVVEPPTPIGPKPVALAASSSRSSIAASTGSGLTEPISR